MKLRPGKWECALRFRFRPIRKKKRCRDHAIENFEGEIAAFPENAKDIARCQISVSYLGGTNHLKIISTYAEGKIKTKVPDHAIWHFMIINSNLGCPGCFMPHILASSISPQNYFALLEK